MTEKLICIKTSTKVLEVTSSNQSKYFHQLLMKGCHGTKRNTHKI